MIQITQFPIKKYIYYEITIVLKAMNGGFHDTFSVDHKSLAYWTKYRFQPTDVTADVATLIILCQD